MMCFSYLRGIDGHLHLVLLGVEALKAASPPERAVREKFLSLAVEHVKKQARLHPVVAAHRDLAVGLRAAALGNVRLASRRFGRAIAAASRMSLRWEEASASLALAALVTPDRREVLLARAELIATETGDALLARASAALRAEPG